METGIIIFIIFVIVFFVIIPGIGILCMRTAAHREVGLFYGREYAHRGLHGGAVPENSMTAFRLAVEEGYGVELDVQMTKDERLVVFHDATLTRMCGQEGFLRDYTYEELQNFRLGDTKEQIPLFSDVLETLGTTTLVCELKSDNGARNYHFCEKVYEELEKYKGNYCMESFSPFITGWFKKNHPEVIRGQLSCHMEADSGLGFAGRFILTNMLLNFISRPDFIAYNFKHTYTPGYQLVKKIYKPFRIAWTPRGPEEIATAKKEFETIIFEKDPVR